MLAAFSPTVVGTPFTVARSLLRQELGHSEDGCSQCLSQDAGNCFHASWPGKSYDKCSQEKNEDTCESNDNGVWCKAPPPATCPEGYESASWTTYTSYACCCPNNPNYDPKCPKEECEDYSACQYPGDFAFIDHESFDWVKSHQIVAFFTSHDTPSGTEKKYARKLLDLHDPKTGTDMPSVEVADTCGDSDCGGCCTKNAKPSGNLIDMEYWTVKHFFPDVKDPEDVADGTLCWKVKSQNSTSLLF
jgi:hypothetical protein